MNRCDYFSDVIAYSFSMGWALIEGYILQGSYCFTFSIRDFMLNMIIKINKNNF